MIIMGTSSSNSGTRGKGTPLVPTWLDSGENAESTLQIETTAGQNTPGSSPPNYPSLPSAADANRFRTVRSNFSRFARSGGNDRASLKRAISEYITRSSGGTTNAARRLGSSRKASSKLLGFLSDVADRGLPEVLRSLNLEELAGKPIDELFLGLADYICPEGGGVDEGIARESFISTIAELAAEGEIDFNNLNVDQIQTVFELYATRSIEDRIYNDIGINGIALPENEEAVEKVWEQVHEFIKNGVADALTEARDSLENLTPKNVVGYVDKVYERSFGFLVALSNSENE